MQLESSSKLLIAFGRCASPHLTFPPMSTKQQVSTALWFFLVKPHAGLAQVVCGRVSEVVWDRSDHRLVVAFVDSPLLAVFSLSLVSGVLGIDPVYFLRLLTPIFAKFL